MMVKRLLCALLCGVMILGSSVTVFAEDDNYSITDTEKDLSVTVMASGEDKVNVSIPKKVTLSVTDKIATGDCYLRISGDVAASTTVTVYNTKTFTLNQEGKGVATASVVTKDGNDTVSNYENGMTYKTFGVTDISNGKELTYSIRATEITAGAWSGNIGFKIKVNKQ